MNSEDFSYAKLINSVEEKVLTGEQILRSEADALINTPDEHLLRLFAAADRVRIHFNGSHFDSCSIINARSGLCGEDCSFCAQSGHHRGDCEVYPLKPTDEILAAARSAKLACAQRFSVVTSGGALPNSEFDALIESLKRIRSEVDVHFCASLGFLNEDRAQRLVEAGVTRYHHNLETAPDYYPQICTTHTFEQRVKTVQAAKSSGFSVCSGGIIGLGETDSHRLDLAFTLRDLGVDSVPINILNPRPGTPLENVIPPKPLEVLKTVALFRLVLPTATIKLAGGREQNLGDFQAMALRAGANGMIIGGYLTTGGRPVEDDLKMIRQAGFTIGSD